MAALQASQFIGSKISLVTKAEIRYEGILYALDLQDATISLAKVKSFGTEDRPTDRPSPPKTKYSSLSYFVELILKHWTLWNHQNQLQH